MSWNERTLGELATFQRGFDITKKEQNPGPYSVISSSGPKSTHNKAKVCGPGVIIGRKGSLGTVFFSEDDFWPHDTTLWVKDFHGNDPKFVYYVLQTLALERFDVGSSNPTLNRNHIHPLPVRFPKPPVQKEVVKILSAYDDLIENNKRRIALLEESARLLYREWFVHLRFPGHEHVPVVDGVPEGWERVSASDAVDVLSGGTPKTSVGEFWDGDIPFFTPKDAVDVPYVGETEKSITRRGLANCNSRLYPKDTLFITARGTVGRINLAQKPMAMNQSCYALIGKEGLSQRFLYSALSNAVEHFKRQATGAVFNRHYTD